MRIIWILLCSMCCFVDIFFLTVQYMKYDTKASVKVMFDDIIHLPPNILCTSIAALLNWDDERLQCM